MYQPVTHGWSWGQWFLLIILVANGGWCQTVCQPPQPSVFLEAYQPLQWLVLQLYTCVCHAMYYQPSWSNIIEHVLFITRGWYWCWWGLIVVGFESNQHAAIMISRSVLVRVSEGLVSMGIITADPCLPASVVSFQTPTLWLLSPKMLRSYFGSKSSN